jgi:hypothetical protein
METTRRPLFGLLRRKIPSTFASAARDADTLPLLQVGMLDGREVGACYSLNRADLLFRDYGQAIPSFSEDTDQASYPGDGDVA